MLHLQRSLLLIPLLFHKLVNSLQVNIDGFDIPERTLSDFGTYPNPLRVTAEDRAQFHPVVKFPTIKVVKNEANTNHQEEEEVPNIQVLDFTVRSETRQLATVHEQAANRNAPNRNRRTATHTYAVGRYDEDRVGLYESDLFDNLDNDIDGYAGRRTIHMGIDLDGPLGTEVYSFWEGTILHAGYNAELGDYGNVIVIRHELPSSVDETTNGNDGELGPRVVYALYGHLDDDSIKGRQPGDVIQRGELLGEVGDIEENGGWFNPHVHFQLSLKPPETHDMPGAVSDRDRARALVDYPDPRYILGPLY